MTPPGPGTGGARWVSARGARLWLHAAGDGVPLVLVHGWAMDHRVFSPQVDEFARHFRTITYDRRGFGRSTGVPNPERELDDIEVVVGKVCGEAAGRRFHLLGLSQGGRIALRYAAARPDRLRSLVLQGAPVGGEEAEGPADERIPLDELAALARAGHLAELRRRWLQHPLMRLGEGNAEAERLLRDMLGDYAGADLIAGPWRPRESAADVLRALAAAELPVLVVTGAGETEARRRAARRLLDGLPHAKGLVLAASGHLCNLTEPDLYNSAVIEFCRGVDTGR